MAVNVLYVCCEYDENGVNEFKISHILNVT